jgi:membrane-associated phospholipid phosphatase
MKTVSVVFHPLLMPSFTFLLINMVLPELVHPLGWFMLPFLFVTTFLIPLFGVSALKFSGNISSFSLEKREERFLPFLFVSIFYAITTVLFIRKVGVNGTIATMLIATTVLIALLMLISLFYKISIHSAGVSGVVGFLLVLCFQHPESFAIYTLVPAIVTAGLVMTSRLYLHAHKPDEILSGFVVGIGICFGALHFFG